MNYPLPLSSNFRLFGYTIRSGPLNAAKVVWPASFLKDDESVEPRHVFILQHEDNRYQHAFWKYDMKHPLLLPTKHYGVFKKDLAAKLSNRYLFQVHGKTLLLPYVPPALHEQWFNVGLAFRDDAKVLGLFKEHNKHCKSIKKRKRSMKFRGWRLESKSKSIINSYKKKIFEMPRQTTLKLSQHVDNLSEQDHRRLKDAVCLLHAILPNLIKKI